MRALQALVVIMGILLLAGSATLACIVAFRFAGSRPAIVTATATASRARIVLPPGGRVDSVTALGQHLALHVSAETGESILIVEPTTGAIVETIELKTADK